MFEDAVTTIVKNEDYYSLALMWKDIIVYVDYKFEQEELARRRALLNLELLATHPSKSMINAYEDLTPYDF